MRQKNRSSQGHKWSKDLDPIVLSARKPRRFVPSFLCASPQAIEDGFWLEVETMLGRTAELSEQEVIYTIKIT